MCDYMLQDPCLLHDKTNVSKYFEVDNPPSQFSMHKSQTKSWLHFMAPGQKIKQFRADARRLSTSKFFCAHLSPSKDMRTVANPLLWPPVTTGEHATRWIFPGVRQLTHTHTRVCFCSICVYKLC